MEFRPPLPNKKNWQPPWRKKKSKTKSSVQIWGEQKGRPTSTCQGKPTDCGEEKRRMRGREKKGMQPLPPLLEWFHPPPPPHTCAGWVKVGVTGRMGAEGVCNDWAHLRMGWASWQPAPRHLRCKSSRTIRVVFRLLKINWVMSSWILTLTFT